MKAVFIFFGLVSLLDEITGFGRFSGLAATEIIIELA
jgi:hypothetical protein